MVFQVKVKSELVVSTDQSHHFEQYLQSLGKEFTKTELLGEVTFTIREEIEVVNA